MLEIKTDFPLAKISTYKVGGNAAFVAYPATLDELREAIAWAADHNLPMRVLGGGSNLLVSDEGFDGLIIFYSDKTITVDAKSGTVLAGAGAVTAAVAGATVREGLAGFEWAVGVPGTIGGAIYGNAGASGGEMKDSVVRVSAFENNALRIFTNEECEFGYRRSYFKKNNAIILGVELRLDVAADPLQPKEKMLSVLQYRNETQPKGLASSGCTFKNYEIKDDAEAVRLKALDIPQDFLDKKRIPTGWLIERAKLKDVCVGGACVSHVHGNFIVNQGDATATDISKLISVIKTRVFEVFGISIEEEITLL